MTRFIEFTRSLVRNFARALLLMTLVVTTTIVLVISSHDSDQALLAQDASQQGWGHVALSQVYSGMSGISPISLANACGLGASSCFRCHNGKRAVAASMDASKAPWHSNHTKVNNSCAGCHRGNPRLMKEKMAHSRMLSDPRSDLQQACATCHSGDDLDALSKPYTSLPGENKS